MLRRFCQLPARKGVKLWASSSSNPRSYASSTSPYVKLGWGSHFQVSTEVQHAVMNNLPVVALESAIYTHGFPYPENIQLGLDLEAIVRSHGAVPATIGVVGGTATVGLTESDQLVLMESAGNSETMKVSRKDLPYILGIGISASKLNGGTTVSGTMVLARKAGIRVFGTGGLGGVHRGGQDSMDISADLTELGRTDIAIISSGCKSFLDIPRTLEYLETQGVTVCTFADGRTGDIDFPAFYTRDSGTKCSQIIQNAKQAAAILASMEGFRRVVDGNGMLFANPIPEEFALPKQMIDRAIDQAIKEATEQGIYGHANTPFILAKIKELTEGNSLPANRALIKSNVAMAANVATEYSQLLQTTPYLSNHYYQALYREPISPGATKANALSKIDILARQASPLVVPDISMSMAEDSATTNKKAGEASEEFSLQTSTMKSRAPTSEEVQPNRPLITRDPRVVLEKLTLPKVLIFGSVALDVSCDFVPAAGSKDVSPQMHTSNLATIKPSIGGVGYNVALAAQYVTGNASASLYSFVADDLAGQTIYNDMASSHAERTVMMIPSTPTQRTAQYIAINDTQKNLIVAMADMGIFESDTLRRYISDFKIWPRLKWVVVDANWKPEIARQIMNKYSSAGVKVAFEPVSVAKAARIMAPAMRNDAAQLGIYPNHVVDLATPNQHELASMYAAAKHHGLFESQRWWEVIDSLGISSAGARSRFVSITNTSLTDQGIPLQNIQLLPFFPTIITKLGAEGLLLTELLGPEDPRLTDPAHSPYILSRTFSSSTENEIGGVYMRLFPSVEHVDDTISVNGVGDTLLGVLVAGLANGTALDEKLINLAQKAAVMTLRSEKSVHPDLCTLKDELAELTLSAQQIVN